MQTATSESKSWLQHSPSTSRHVSSERMLLTGACWAGEMERCKQKQKKSRGEILQRELCLVKMKNDFATLSNKRWTLKCVTRCETALKITPCKPLRQELSPSMWNVENFCLMSLLTDRTRSIEYFEVAGNFKHWSNGGSDFIYVLIGRGVTWYGLIASLILSLLIFSEDC